MSQAESNITKPSWFNSLRTRLLLAYAGVIILGFALLTLFAGRQISAAAQADYEQRLISETELIAQSVNQRLDRSSDDETNQGLALDVLNSFGTQITDRIAEEILFYPTFGNPGGRNAGGGMLPRRPLNRFSEPPDFPELNAARDGRIEMNTRDGYLYAAAPVKLNNRPIGLIQVRAPAAKLDEAVRGRWIQLGGGFLGLTLLTLLASLWLSNMLTRPLKAIQHSAVRLAHGDFSHRITYSGVSEIGEVANAFNEMAFQVESMLEEQRAFASNTAHELRTPLTTIRLRTEALRYDATMDATTQRQYVEEIDDEIVRLGNLVTDLTLLSRFEAGRAELGRETIDFARFVEHMRAQMAGDAAAQGVNLRVYMPPGDSPMIVYASLTHLTVVFRNLLDNALKYTPADKGGRVDWTVRVDGDKLHTTIVDTGRGIPLEHLPHIFERFYRADTAHTRAVGGTGLGLALVKSILDAYGGSIHIESAGVDKGTTVTVIWPLAR